VRVAKHIFDRWIAEYLARTRRFRFEWDRWNEPKIELKHDIKKFDAEQIFHSRSFRVLGKQVSPASSEERYGIVGRLQDGRILHVTFTIRNRRIRVISVRPAKKRERKEYEKDKGVRPAVAGV